MTQDEFLKYLGQQVQNYKAQYSLSDGKAFGLWYAIDSLGLEEDEAYEAVSYDGGNDKDIDFFFIDHEAERVLVGQLKFNAKGRYKGKKGELLGLIHTTDWLKDPEALERDGRKDIAAAARDYLDAVGKGYSVEYLYVFCGPGHKDVDDTARNFNVTEAGSVPSRSCRVVSLPNLIAEHSERIDQTKRIDSVTLTCPPNRFQEKGSFGMALVTTLTGTQLRDLYLQHADRLFDRNIRLFLGARKGGVNAGIRDTIGSAKDRLNFWAYNNGVTFVCDHYELKDDDLTLTNFSIVNGCQTTVTIANSPATAVKDFAVLVRFIASPESAIDHIIRYTNSQTPIRLWDLSAQDKRQKRLKKELAALPQPYLYVLRKGETRQLPTAERQKYKRRGKGAMCAIPHDRNAQYLAAFRSLPAVAYKEKGRIFSAHYDEVFPDQIRAEEVVLVWQAGSVAADVVRKELEKAVRGGDQHSRVAILKRGAKFFVLAAMAIILHERNGKTFLNKLTADVAVSKATENRLGNYAAIALEWYVEAMQDLIDAGNEVTTLVRSQEWWTKVRQKVVSKWKVYSLSRNVVEEGLPAL